MALTTVKSDQIQTSVALAGSPTTTTQSASDNSTKVATTAYVETAVANLVASAPSALNTLDELAAALNDDASFSTTVTNSIATKLPLAGGTLTGALTINANGPLTLNGTDPLISLQNGGSNHWQLGFENTQSDRFVIYDNNANSYRLIIDNSGNTTFAGTGTFAGGAANNNDDANILTLNASQHARLLVDTSSVAGHRATLALESNGNELTLSTTGSNSYLTNPTGAFNLQIATDKVISFAPNIGEIGSVTGFQATNTAGTANTDFGIRATTIRLATGSAERMRIDGSGHAEFYHDFKHNPDSASGHRYMWLNRTSGRDGHLIFTQSGTNQWQQTTDSNHHLRFYSYQNGAGFQFSLLSSGGIAFGTDTSSANALDDYEEGSMTLGSLAGHTNITGTPSQTYAIYTKIGSLIHIQGGIAVNPTGTGKTAISFTVPIGMHSSTGVGLIGVVTAYPYNTDRATGPVLNYTGANNTQVYMETSVFTNASTTFSFQMTYRT